MLPNNTDNFQYLKLCKPNPCSVFLFLFIYYFILFYFIFFLEGGLMGYNPVVGELVFVIKKPIESS